MPALFFDFLPFLRAAYVASRQDAPDNEKQPTLDGFVTWAGNYLAHVNQPINVAYLAIGMGLRLQNGETLAFSPQTAGVVPMKDEGIHITNPGGSPTTGLVPSNSTPVSGN